MQFKWMFIRRFTLSTQKIAPVYGNSHKKCTSLAAIARYITIRISCKTRLSTNFLSRIAYFFTKKQVSMVFNKITILSLFYLARLVSITGKHELQTSKIPSRAIKPTFNKSLLVFTDFFTGNAHPHKPDKRSVSH